VHKDTVAHLCTEVDVCHMQIELMDSDMVEYAIDMVHELDRTYGFQPKRTMSQVQRLRQSGMDHLQRRLHHQPCISCISQPAFHREYNLRRGGLLMCTHFVLLLHSAFRTQYGMTICACTCTLPCPSFHASQISEAQSWLMVGWLDVRQCDVHCSGMCRG
jgi:hypothetical protein